MTKDAFSETVGYLQVAFGHRLSDDARGAYWMALKEMDASSFKRSAEHIVVSFVPSAQCPFPVPAHFLKGCGEDEDSAVSLAISKLKEAIIKKGSYKSVDFGDRALHSVVTRFAGGWPVICLWSDKDWQINLRAFKEAYIAALRHGDRGPEHLAGIAECHNGTVEQIEHVGEPARISEILALPQVEGG